MEEKTYIEYWMYDVLIETLEKEYSRAVKSYTKGLHFNLRNMTPVQEKAWEEIKNNRYNPVGAINLALQALRTEK